MSRITLPKALLRNAVRPLLLAAGLALAAAPVHAEDGKPACCRPPREQVSINDGWRFFKYPSGAQVDGLIYDVRPPVIDEQDDKPADAQPTEAEHLEMARNALKPWVLPSGNDFIKDPAKRHTRPKGDPGSDFPFVQAGFDDSGWQAVTLPHDWAIAGPFMAGPDAEVGGSMARLPSPGVAWYRRKLDIPASDAGRRIYLDVEGAMSYAIVWFNGRLVGGWPYGYNSWRLDLTPHVDFGGENQLAIRVDNPGSSSRWYPGAGLYRDVWLTKTQPVHVAQWGSFVSTRDVSSQAATVDLSLAIANDSGSDADVEAQTRVYALDPSGRRTGEAIAEFEPVGGRIVAGEKTVFSSSVRVDEPRLWGPPPTQAPNLYVAETTLRSGGKVVDRYETRFGIRSLRLDGSGLHVNGERIFIKGVNQHHDLGALGAAFNLRAAERQLELLREAGCNAVRLSHNPPASGLLDLLDRMGFLVVDEVFDAWELKKRALDFHLIFPDWHEQDLRAMIRRDRNHPSIIMWSIGNEVGEQYTGEAGAAVARRLYEISKDEDPTRQVTASMNFAKPGTPMPGVLDIISLNYQGEGIRDTPAYSGLKGITTPPLYGAFHEAYPDKLLVSSENASALSTRGVYLFPVYPGNSAPVRDGSGGNDATHEVSAYGLYSSPFGASPDKVFAAEDAHPFVGGGFVWTGWDHLGEPTPYYAARSSYCGFIDLAGFKKDRFYLYQARWRPELPMAHILPHWKWPERVGQVTPVHVYTSGDEAELFLNGRSLGRKEMGEGEYRLRWDDVVYEPGELLVIAYRDGMEWARDAVTTTGAAAALRIESDVAGIRADGRDLAFITLRVVDKDGRTVPDARNRVHFSVDGPGVLVATDNGDPKDFTAFPSPQRDAFNGLCLAIVRGVSGKGGMIVVTATGEGLEGARVELEAKVTDVCGAYKPACHSSGTQR